MIRMKSNDRKQTEKIKENKSWSVEKINETDKPIVDWSRKEEKNPHIVNFKNKKRAITMNPAHIKKGNKIILEQLHANKFDNLHKKNKFAVKNDLTKTDGKSDTKSE